jgi:hypothetical protein
MAKNKFKIVMAECESIRNSVEHAGQILDTNPQYAFIQLLQSLKDSRNLTEQIEILMSLVPEEYRQP